MLGRLIGRTLGSDPRNDSSSLSPAANIVTRSSSGLGRLTFDLATAASNSARHSDSSHKIIFVGHGSEAEKEHLPPSRRMAVDSSMTGAANYE